MPRTGTACGPACFAVEEFSIGELLDDPIARLLMRSDGVDRQAVERLLRPTRSPARSNSGMSRFGSANP
jgi:hypothetical protein